MRNRARVLKSLEGLYREAFDAADETSDDERMAELDFGFQRDQVFLEVLLDLRDLLTAEGDDTEESETSLLEKAKAIRKFTKLTGR